MSNNPVQKFFPELIIPQDYSPEIVIETLGKYGIQNLAYGGDIGSNPGYIFRGEANWNMPLQTSLERRVRSKCPASSFKDELKKTEQSLIRCFIEGLGGRVAGIFYPNRTHLISDVADDIFWWLALMQHYGLSTRLIDFTRDIRIALYFAIEQAEQAKKVDKIDEDLIIYCFPCLDRDGKGDFNSNKNPIKPCENYPIDMNRALGCLIELEWMEKHRIAEQEANQKFGWDCPYYQNPRLKSQEGMFVYPFKYPTETSFCSRESWFVQNLDHKDPFNLCCKNNSLPPLRIRIGNSHIPALKKILVDQYGLCKETVYERGKKISLNGIH